jgi:hypothetical protein
LKTYEKEEQRKKELSKRTATFFTHRD